MHAQQVAEAGSSETLRVNRPRLQADPDSISVVPANEASINVGTRSIFAAAGYQEISHPTLRRVVMRVDF